MLEYKILNFRSPFFLIITTITVSLIILCFFVYFKTNINLLLVFGIVLSAFELAVIYYNLKSKIILTDEEVITQTPFRVKKLKYADIKTFAVYASSRFSYVVEPTKHHEWLPFKQKFIYLSSQNDYLQYGSSFFFKNHDDYIHFHYRREIYDFILQRLNASA